MILWRIAHERFADLSGMGGLHRPGRWHSVGRPIVYTAEHSALAMLEVRVHLDLVAAQLAKFVMMKISVQDNIPLHVIDGTPQDEAATRSQGDDWLRTGLTCLCRVKSALAPEAFNYLINPLHADMASIAIDAITPLTFDARLFR